MVRQRLDTAGRWLLQAEAALLVIAAVAAVMSTMPFRNIDPGEGAERSADPAFAIPLAAALALSAVPLIDCAFLTNPAQSQGRVRLRRASVVIVAMGHHC
jgi:hypothetical protein